MEKRKRLANRYMPGRARYICKDYGYAGYPCIKLAKHPDTNLAELLISRKIVNKNRQILFTKIIFIYSPIEILEKRMRDRGDKEESIQKRLKNIEDSKEFENDKYADLVVENIDFEKVKNQIISYILTI